MSEILASSHQKILENDYAQWFRQQVQIGLEQANAGKVISHAEVEARFAAKCAALRRKIGAEE